MSDLGKKPVLKWLPVDRLTVDPKYQRDTGSRRSRKLIEKIAQEFKWSRFGVVLVVRNGSGWHVIDGQHRAEAARIRGDIKEVPAVVLPHATIEEAAADFVAINRDRVMVTPLHIHHAMLAAGDAEATAIDRACRKAGVEICRYAVPLANLKPGQTVAVATVARLVRLRGEDFAAKALKRALAGAGVLSAQAIKYAAEGLGLASRDGAKPVNKPTIRACLGCGQRFASEGNWHRMCTDCRRRT